MLDGSFQKLFSVDQATLLFVIQFSNLARSYGPGRIPVANHPWGQIAQDSTACSDDCATPDGHTGADEDIVWKPNFIFNMDRLLFDGKIYPGIVVEPGAEVHVVRDRDIRTNDDFA